MALDILCTWIIYVTCLSTCLAFPATKMSSHSGATQALENSGINPKDVVNNQKNIVRIHKFKRLYSRNSAKFVRIYNGTVDGNGDKDDINVTIKLESMGSRDQVILKSYDATVCVCLDRNGSVVAKACQQGGKTDQGCIFAEEHSLKGYTHFRSTLNDQWYLAITSKGQTKSGRKTNPGQRAVQFIEYHL